MLYVDGPPEHYASAGNPIAMFPIDLAFVPGGEGMDEDLKAKVRARAPENRTATTKPIILGRNGGIVWPAYYRRMSPRCCEFMGSPVTTGRRIRRMRFAIDYLYAAW